MQPRPQGLLGAILKSENTPGEPLGRSYVHCFKIFQGLKYSQPPQLPPTRDP